MNEANIREAAERVKNAWFKVELLESVAQRVQDNPDNSRALKEHAQMQVEKAHAQLILDEDWLAYVVLLELGYDFMPHREEIDLVDGQNWFIDGRPPLKLATDVNLVDDDDDDPAPAPMLIAE